MELSWFERKLSFRGGALDLDAVTPGLLGFSDGDVRATARDETSAFIGFAEIGITATGRGVDLYYIAERKDPAPLARAAQAVLEKVEGLAGIQTEFELRAYLPAESRLGQFAFDLIPDAFADAIFGADVASAVGVWYNVHFPDMHRLVSVRGVGNTDRHGLQLAVREDHTIHSARDGKNATSIASLRRLSEFCVSVVDRVADWHAEHGSGS